MGWHDEQNVTGHWFKSSLIMFEKAIKKYLECLEPIKGDGNKTVEKEVQDWQAILQRIQEIEQPLQHPDEEGELILLGKNYGKLYDILWKDYSAKKQLLEERKKKILDEAAHEGAETEIEEMRQMLDNGTWQNFTRHKTLVESFYPKEEPKKESQNVQMQITIGNIYGQFAAINNGTMVQNNNSEAVQALREITDALIASKLADQEKQEALLDVETIQTQLKKGKPNKKVLEIGMASLQVAANSAQIWQAVQPHFDKIQHFISTLPIPH